VHIKVFRSKSFYWIYSIVSPFFASKYPNISSDIKIPVTYYDFHSDGSNPEFEKVGSGISPHLGMMLITLDVQRKPVLDLFPYLNCQIAKCSTLDTRRLFHSQLYKSGSYYLQQSDNHCKLRYSL